MTSLCLNNQAQGPVVQSIISLTSSLKGQLIKSITTLEPNTLVFLLKKSEELLNAKAFHVFLDKNSGIFQI